MIEFPVGTWSPWVRAHSVDVAFTRQDDDPDRSLRKRADALAASIELTMGTRSATLAVHCLREDLPASLALAKEVLANTRYDEHELKRARREQAILWRGNETDVSFRMAQAEARGLFSRDDPRRLPYEKPQPPGTDIAKLVAVRDQLIRLPGRLIGFAGDLTLDDAQRSAHELLTATSAAAGDSIAPRLYELNPQASRAKDQDIAMRKLTQVYLRLGRDSLPWTDPRRPAFLVADHVLGGHFYSRLYVALRHGEGDTYATGTIREGEPAAGAYAAWTYSRNANAAATEAKLRDVLSVLHERGITEEERADAVGYFQGRRAFNVQSPGQVLDRILWERSRGLAAGYRDALIERAAALPLDEVNEFVRRYYDPARFTMIRVETK
jgi:predicted Zn-dependent peptidase